MSLHKQTWVPGTDPFSTRDRGQFRVHHPIHHHKKRRPRKPGKPKYPTDWEPPYDVVPLGPIDKEKPYEDVTWRGGKAKADMGFHRDPYGRREPNFIDKKNKLEQKGPEYGVWHGKRRPPKVGLDIPTKVWPHDPNFIPFKGLTSGLNTPENYTTQQKREDFLKTSKLQQFFNKHEEYFRGVGIRFLTFIELAGLATGIGAIVKFVGKGALKLLFKMLSRRSRQISGSVLTKGGNAVFRFKNFYRADLISGGYRMHPAVYNNPKMYWQFLDKVKKHRGVTHLTPSQNWQLQLVFAKALKFKPSKFVKAFDGPPGAPIKIRPKNLPYMDEFGTFHAGKLTKFKLPKTRQHVTKGTRHSTRASDRLAGRAARFGDD